MNVGQLISMLSDLEQDTPVVLSVDEEGNNFRSLYDVVIYDGGETIELLEDTSAEAHSGYPAVVLWP